MNRRTKIVCTLGPASSDEETLRAMIRAGMDVARFNFSHGTHEYHRKVMDRVRKAAEMEGRRVAILQDLQGPKLRVGKVKGKRISIESGSRLVITPEPLEESTHQRIYVNYPTLADDLEIGGEILFDDGHIELKVVDIQGRDIVTEVLVGGPLTSRKGVNLPNIKTSTPALTEKDLSDLEFGLLQGVDIVALSFVRDASDVSQLVDRIVAADARAMVVAKVEKPEAVACIDDIVAVAGGIMVARGDLGIEMRLSRVPGTQKSIISKCLASAVPVITATQMLESMIDNPRPTRAEVSDVANAVLDGSDAVMLSGETAIGKYPVRAVEVMSDVCIEAERIYLSRHIAPVADSGSHEVTESVARTACQLAAEVDAVAIACLTASGATARSISRHRPHVPLFAFTDDRRILGQLALSWGTKGFYIPFQYDTDKGITEVHEVLKSSHEVEEGDFVVMTAGMPLPLKGRTNMVHVSRI